MLFFSIYWSTKKEEKKMTIVSCAANIFAQVYPDSIMHRGTLLFLSLVCLGSQKYFALWKYYKSKQYSTKLAN